MAETEGADQAPNARTPLTWILIALCVIVAFITKLGDDLTSLSWFTFSDFRVSPDGRSLISSWPDDLKAGQFWRLITPIFLHFGFVHIFFNMLWLKDLGQAIEARQKSLFLLLQVIVIGLLSNAAQFWMNFDFIHGLRVGPQPLFGGMSGVVFGLLGYLWIRGRRDPSYGMQLSRQTVIMMLGWLALCTAGIIGAVANVAHAVGLLTGLAWGWWASRSATPTTSP